MIQIARVFLAFYINMMWLIMCAGSPFTVKVNGPPDPSKVRVSGPGIHNGVLQQYNGSFTVSTQGAGPGELTVKIRGPKGLLSVLGLALAAVVKNIHFYV